MIREITVVAVNQDEDVTGAVADVILADFADRPERRDKVSNLLSNFESRCGYTEV